MKVRFTPLLLAAAVFALPNLVQAQIGIAHYPAGAEGIKAASLPPPGVYARDYNFFYTAERFKGGPPGFERVSAYVNAPRLIYMTDKKIFGADYGMDIILPFGYLNWEGTAPAPVGSQWSFGDIQLEPLLLSWHLKQFDIAGGYALWVPTGPHDSPRDLGNGLWTDMLTLGGTWYPDKAKTWAVSVLNRYEINMGDVTLAPNRQGVTPGNVWTAEVGISKSLQKTIDVGAVGYFQWQTTKNCDDIVDPRPQIFGVGPEVSLFCPKLGLFTSLRYAYELAAHDHTEGHKLVLTLTRRF